MWKGITSAAGALAAIEIGPVAVAIAASIIAKRLLPYAVGLAAFFWLVRWLAYGQFTVRTPTDLPLAMIVLLTPVTLWASAYPQLTLPEILRLLSAIALCYAIVNWSTSTDRLRWLVAVIPAMGLLLALSGLVTVDWPARKEVLSLGSAYKQLPAPILRAMHPNTMAAALVLLCTLALVMLLFAWREQRPAAHIASGLAVAGMVAFLPLTQSRGALLGLGMSLALALVLRWRRGWLVLLPMGLAVVVAVRMFGMEALLESVTYSDTMRSLEGRLEMWSRGVYIIEDFPLTGIGMGTFYPVAGILYPYLIDPNAGHAHNLLLQVGVDLGLPGLVAWLAILLLVVTGAWELYQEGRKRGDRWLAGLGAGLLCSQVALLVHGMVDATSWITWAMVVPWGLWGIAIAARRLLEEEPRSPADPQARRANARTRS